MRAGRRQDHCRRLALVTGVALTFHLTSCGQDDRAWKRVLQQLSDTAFDDAASILTEGGSLNDAAAAYLPTEFPGENQRVIQVAAPPEADQLILDVSLGAAGSDATRSQCFRLTLEVDGTERLLERIQVPCPLPTIDGYPITYGFELATKVIKDRRETLPRPGATTAPEMSE